MSNDGVWYNVESYAIQEFGLFDGRVSLHKRITESQLSTISSYISKHDYWNLSYNCSCFVKDIWNEVASNKDEKVDCGWLINKPEWLCNSITKKDVYYRNYHIKTNSKIGYIEKDVFYYETPDDLGGSSSSSSLESTPQISGSFPEGISMEEMIMAQLEYNNSNLTYEEYLQLSDTEVS